MPPRHISPQSFDDILSELGNDPAIPDPHGIRKSSPPPRASPQREVKSQSPSLTSPQLLFNGFKTSSILMVVGLFALTIGTVFFLLESNKANSEQELNSLKGEIFTLKNELALTQSDWLTEQEGLYNAIDEIEVSIHYLEEKPILSAPQTKSPNISHEAELRRWKYLGVTQMGVIQQAFFHTGKTTLMVGKEGLVLGEWHLAQAGKEVAVLSHPKGKSITLKSTKSE